MRKVSMLLLALVLALGVLGAGYAMWSDVFYINGTVSTGIIDVNLDPNAANSTSSTYVYKDLTTNQIVFTTAASNDTNLLYVASAVATSVGNDTINMTFDNIFPTYDLTYNGSTAVNITGEHPLIADASLVYDGTIPVHVWYDFTSNISLTGFHISWTLDPVTGPNVTVTDPSATGLDGWQLHSGDKVYVQAWFDPSELQAAGNAAMGLSGSFAIKYGVYQWNEPKPATLP